MAKNRLGDLRDHLFETLEGLKDGSIDIAKAESISKVAQTIVNSAKVEVDMVRVLNGRLPDNVHPGRFFELQEDPKPGLKKLA